MAASHTRNFNVTVISRHPLKVKLLRQFYRNSGPELKVGHTIVVAEGRNLKACNIPEIHLERQDQASPQVSRFGRNMKLIIAW